MKYLKKLVEIGLMLVGLMGPATTVCAATGSWNGIGFTAWNGVAITSWNGTSISTGGGAPTYTLIYDSVVAGGTAQEVGNTSIYRYGANTTFVDTVDRAVSKLAARVTKAAGDISGKTYYFKIWSLSGSSLGSILATSAGITGNNSWSNTVVEDTISYTIPASTTVAITFDCGGVDGSNYLQMYFIDKASASAPFPASLATFGNTGSETYNFSAYNMQMKLYVSP